jgi:hypothetical protein
MAHKFRNCVHSDNRPLHPYIHPAISKLEAWQPLAVNNMDK